MISFCLVTVLHCIDQTVKKKKHSIQNRLHRPSINLQTVKKKWQIKIIVVITPFFLSDVFSCTPLSFMANWKLIGVKLMRLLYWRRSRRSPVRLSAPLNSVDCLWWRTLTVWTQWPKWFKMKYFNNHLHS